MNRYALQHISCPLLLTGQEPLPYDPAKAKRWLAEAGYPHGLEAGDLVPIPPAFTLGETVVNNLNAVGMHTRMVPMERAPFDAA